MRREGLFRQTAKRDLDDSIRANRTIAERYHGVPQAYERLLWHIRTRSTLLHPSGRPGDSRVGFNAGLLALALYYGDWLRSVELWQPAEQNPWPLFMSLAQHLLARYPVPAFMNSAWLDLPPGEKLPHHEWYKHLGRGENIRTVKLPLQMTRVMAHWFTQAPHHFSVIQAIRWAQVRGLGGSDGLARAVVGTRLGKNLENEDFWASVLHFFINHPLLNLADVGPVVDYLQHQRYEWREVSRSGAIGKMPPPRPDYSMKGRTTASILRQVAEWHKELSREGNEPIITWRHSPFNDFRFVEGTETHGKMRAWTIAEILTSRALIQEGQEMRHCVATYQEDCIRRQASIWSVQVESQRGSRRALTIDVDIPTKTIWQVRGRYNRMPSAGEQAIIGRWAAVEGLKIDAAAWF